MSPADGAALHRQRLASRLEGAFVLLFSGEPPIRNGDVKYPFRPESDFWWLTGWPEPRAVALFRPGHTPAYILFVTEVDPAQAYWEGPRAGVAEALSIYGADVAYPFEELVRRLPNLLQGADTLHLHLGVDPDMDALVLGAIRKTRRAAHRNGLEVPDRLVDPCVLLHELRLVKDDFEQEALRRAARVTSDGIVAAMAGHESESAVQAAIEAVYRRNGAVPAFPTIVASGARATVLHYTRNDARLSPGELVLVDTGAEIDGYGADISRTYPVSGRFLPHQRQIYELVLTAWGDVVDLVRPGVSLQDLHDTARRSLAGGLRSLGLLPRDHRDGLSRFYMHPTCHWLGLDTHDVGRQVVAGTPRPLEAGMVFTVEPGLYFPQDPSLPPELRGVGVRLEDDVLVTATGCEVLTAGCPREIAEIEALHLPR